MPFKNQHPLYSTWKTMRHRCQIPTQTKWKDYGGRGITVCARWQRFANFLADMGERPEGHVLDRIDNDGPYEPSNCRWVTPRQSQSNRRITIRYEIEGQTYLLADLARMSGAKPDTIKARIRRGETTLAEIAKQENFSQRKGLALGSAISSAMRKARTHCRRGHLYDEKNTGHQKSGRYCRACNALMARKIRNKLKGDFL